MCIQKCVCEYVTRLSNQIFFSLECMHYTLTYVIYLHLRNPCSFVVVNNNLLYIHTTYFYYKVSLNHIVRRISYLCIGFVYFPVTHLMRTNFFVYLLFITQANLQTGRRKNYRWILKIYFNLKSPPHFKRAKD